MTADPEQVAKMIAAVSASLVLLGQVVAGGAGTALSTDRATMQTVLTSVLKEAQEVTATVEVQLR